MTVRVTVMTAFPYRGRDLRPGDVLEMDLADALIYQHRHLLVSRVPPAYHTRELTAR